MSLSKKRNLAVALMAAVVAVAQAGDIKGVVVDKELNEPLMGASDYAKEDVHYTPLPTHSATVHNFLDCSIR